MERQPPIVLEREVRGWGKLDREAFRTALLNTEVCGPDGRRPESAEDYFDVYHRVLQSLADRFAPVKRLKLRRQRLALWMDDECRQQRRQSRMLERRYRRTLSPVDRLAWVEQERVRHQVYRQKESAYWSTMIAEQAGQPKKLWRSLNAILGRDRAGRLPSNCPTAQQFLDFFNDKVEAVRRSTASGVGMPQSSLAPATDTLDMFVPCSADDVRRTITNAPSKSCSLDPLPTSVMKEFLPELLPFLTALCNACKKGTISSVYQCRSLCGLALCAKNAFSSEFISAEGSGNPVCVQKGKDSCTDKLRK